MTKFESAVAEIAMGNVATRAAERSASWNDSRIERFAELANQLTYGEMIEICAAIVSQNDYKPPSSADEFAQALHRWVAAQRAQ